MKRMLPWILCLFLLCGCAGAPARQSDNAGLRVVTTIFPLYDFVRAVGGDRVAPTLLIDPGTEVHAYDPAPTDVAAICDADLFFYIGGESDGWVDTVLSDVNVCADALLPTVPPLREEGEDEIDEHIWTSPANAVTMIGAICDRMCEADEKNADYYRANASAYCEKITAVGQELRNTVASAENPFLLVADRFPLRYFTEEFGIDALAAMDGCATSADISVKTMQTLVDCVREKNLQYVYTIEMSGRTVANALAAQTGVGVLELQTAHTVTAEQFADGVTYVQLMRGNLAALKKGWGL